MHRLLLPTLAAATTLFLFRVLPGDGHAAGAPGQVCAGTKLAAAGKAANKAVGCHARAAMQGTAVEAACLALAYTKLADAFAKAEARGGCVTTGDASAIAGMIDASAGTLAAALRPATTGNRCAGAKLNAAGRKTQRKLRCHAQATGRGVALDPACLGKAESRFTTAFVAAEARPPCLTTGDADAVEILVDDLLDDAVAALPSVSSTTTTTTTTLAPFCGNGVRDGSEQCDTVAEPICASSGRSGCLPAGSPHECRCCTLPAEIGLIDPSGGALNECCDGAAPEPIAPGAYLCPGTCGASSFPACGGSCPGGTICAPLTNGAGSFCGCAPPGPCDATCSGAECPAGQVCDFVACSCVAP